MKKLLMISITALMAASCGSDDNAPADPTTTTDLDGIKQNISEVYPNGVPMQVDGCNIELDTNGLISKIYDDYSCVTFDYSAVSARSGNRIVTMRIDDSDEDEGEESYDICRLTINEEGLVTYCHEEEYYNGECDTQEWWFKYSNRHLTWMKRTEGDNEVTTISYTDNDITKVSMMSDSPENSYTSQTYYGNNPIANKWGIMLWDFCFEIDMDEMKYAGYAGFLGKATHHLPTKTVNNDYVYEDTFEWSFDGNGRPVSVTAKEDNCTISFKWR